MLLLLTGQILLSQNLVTNPGFETWETPIRPSGWIISENCESNATYFISGLYSCKHSGTTTGRSDLSQEFNVISGKEYVLSYFCRTEVTGTGVGARIWCNWLDIDGKVIIDDLSAIALQPTKYIKNETFQQYTLTTQAPSGAVSFHLEFRTYKNSAAWWDDIIFEETVTTGHDKINSSNIIIYPNPVSNYLTISNIHKIQQIDIQGLTGIVVLSASYNGEKEVSIPVFSLTNGIYLIKITTTEEIYYRKFIKKSNY